MAVFWFIPLFLSSIIFKSSTAHAGLGFVAAGAVKPPITFDGGNVGVNFGGYHASAGLGGLLTGDAAKGGLHAEAGTPFGQSAGAGLGGAVIGEGKAAGGLYAGATSGVGQTAEAGLGGVVSGGEVSGGSIASAESGGGYSTGVSKGFSGSFSSSYNGAGSAGVSEYQAPVVVEEKVLAAPEVRKTYIERTVIPNYVEKTVQVPSYVEKTIRVPTVIEKKVRVPAAPTVIEKTVEAPQGGVHVAGGAEFSGGAVSSEVGHVSYVEKVPPPLVHYHRAVYRKPWFGGFFAGGGYGSGYGGAGGGGQATYSFRKTANPQLINDVFNIPISTLGAVNKLVSGIVGGASGSLSVSKQYSTY